MIRIYTRQRSQLFAAFGDGKRVFQICQFCVHLIFAAAFSSQRAAHTLLRSSECNATENALKRIKIIENCFFLAALSSSGRFKAACRGHWALSMRRTQNNMRGLHSANFISFLYVQSISGMLNNLLRGHQNGKSRFSLGRPTNSINKQCLRHSHNTDDKSLQDFKVERIWQGWKKKAGMQEACARCSA